MEHCATKLRFGAYRRTGMRNFSSQYVHQSPQMGLAVRARSKAIASPLTNSYDARRYSRAYFARVSMCVAITVASICIWTLTLHLLDRGVF
ncbi:MAG: hypothetical protein CMJ28_02885 [Phycisphaerae bacterium]|nr:hypothetical protein [Phycisphaerae bacterium]